MDYWETLEEQSRFETKVLIATSVIDNGVSIEDLDLKHVVIMSCDRVSMFQMLGRKRKEPAETVNVYIRSVSKDRLHYLKNNNDILLGAVSSYRKKAATAFLQQCWQDTSDLSENIRNLFYISYGRNAFPRMVLEWVGLGTDNVESMFLGYESHEETEQQLEMFMATYSGCAFSAEEFDKICEEFMLLYNKSPYKDKKPKPRCEEGRMPAAVRRGLKNAQLPYTIKKKNNKWIVSEVERTS